MARNYMQTSYKLFTKNQKLSVTSTGATRSTAFDTGVTTYRVAGTVDFWLSAGSSTVSASSTSGGNSVFFPANVAEYFNTSKRYISVRANSSTGFVNVCQCEQ